MKEYLLVYAGYDNNNCWSEQLLKIVKGSSSQEVKEQLQASSRFSIRAIYSLKKEIVDPLFKGLNPDY